jgi:hypothetical protein
VRVSLRAIPAEIQRETAAIRARYDSPMARMFPAVVMLVGADSQ